MGVVVVVVVICDVRTHTQTDRQTDRQTESGADVVSHDGEVMAVQQQLTCSDFF